MDRSLSPPLDEKLSHNPSGQICAAKRRIQLSSTVTKKARVDQEGTSSSFFVMSKQDIDDDDSERRIRMREHQDSWVSELKRYSPKSQRYFLSQLFSSLPVDRLIDCKDIIDPLLKRDYIALLPRDCALLVLRYLSPEDLSRCYCVSKKWAEVINDNYLWYSMCAKLKLTPEQVYNEISDPSDLAPQQLKMDDSINYRLLYLDQLKIEKNWCHRRVDQPVIARAHEDHVITCLEFDGRYVVTGSDDNTLLIYDIQQNSVVASLTGHAGGVWCSQIDMKQNVICSGSTDRTIRVWNAKTGQLIHVLHGHYSTVRCLNLRGKYLVSGSRDQTVKVWNIETGALLHNLTGHQSAVRCVVFDGETVVSGGYDCDLRVFDVKKETCRHVCRGHTNRVYSLLFRGRYVVSGSLDTTIRVWNVNDGNCMHILFGHQSLTSSLELRGDILVSANADSTLKIWSISSGQCLRTLAGPDKHRSAVTSLHISRNFVISSSDDGTVKLWNLRTGAFIRDLLCLPTHDHGGVVWRIKATNTKLVCASGSRNGTEDTKITILDFSLPDEDNINRQLVREFSTKHGGTDVSPDIDRNDDLFVARSRHIDEVSLHVGPNHRTLFDQDEDDEVSNGIADDDEDNNDVVGGARTMVTTAEHGERRLRAASLNGKPTTRDRHAATSSSLTGTSSLCRANSDRRQSRDTSSALPSCSKSATATSRPSSSTAWQGADQDGGAANFYAPASSSAVTAPYPRLSKLLVQPHSSDHTIEMPSNGIVDVGPRHHQPLATALLPKQLPACSKSAAGVTRPPSLPAWQLRPTTTCADRDVTTATFYVAAASALTAAYDERRIDMATFKTHAAHLINLMYHSLCPMQTDEVTRAPKQFKDKCSLGRLSDAFFEESPSPGGCRHHRYFVAPGSDEEMAFRIKATPRSSSRRFLFSSTFSQLVASMVINAQRPNDAERRRDEGAAVDESIVTTNVRTLYFGTHCPGIDESDACQVPSFSLPSHLRTKWFMSDVDRSWRMRCGPAAERRRRMFPSRSDLYASLIFHDRTLASCFDGPRLVLTSLYLSFFSYCLRECLPLFNSRRNLSSQLKSFVVNELMMVTAQGEVPDNVPGVHNSLMVHGFSYNTLNLDPYDLLVGTVDNARAGSDDDDGEATSRARVNKVPLNFLVVWFLFGDDDATPLFHALSRRFEVSHVSSPTDRYDIMQQSTTVDSLNEVRSLLPGLNEIAVALYARLQTDNCIALEPPFSRPSSATSKQCPASTSTTSRSDRSESDGAPSAAAGPQLRVQLNDERPAVAAAIDSTMSTSLEAMEDTFLMHLGGVNCVPYLELVKFQFK